MSVKCPLKGEWEVFREIPVIAEKGEIK